MAPAQEPNEVLARARNLGPTFASDVDSRQRLRRAVASPDFGQNISSAGRRPGLLIPGAGRRPPRRAQHSTSREEVSRSQQKRRPPFLPVNHIEPKRFACMLAASVSANTAVLLAFVQGLLNPGGEFNAGCSQRASPRPEKILARLIRAKPQVRFPTFVVANDSPALWRRRISVKTSALLALGHGLQSFGGRSTPAVKSAAVHEPNNSVARLCSACPHLSRETFPGRNDSPARSRRANFFQDGSRSGVEPRAHSSIEQTPAGAALDP